MTFLTREVLEELTHLTYKQVAEKLGVSLATIYYVSKSYGISFSKKRPSKEELEKLSHLKQIEVAQILGISQSLVSYLRIQYGIAKKYKKEKDK
jgi:transposase